MARPEKNTVDYFPHMVGVGKKMFFIEKNHGNDGYATWYKILEKLCETEFHYLNFNIDEEVMFMAAKCNITEDKLLTIISDLSRLGSFDKELWADKIVWSQLFIDSIQDAYIKRKNDCIDKAGLLLLLKSKGILNGGINQIETSVNTQTIVDYSKVDETKVEDTKKSNLIKYFFRIKGKVYDEKISEFIKREKAYFLEVWGMQNGKEKIPPIFDKLDVGYNAYDFNNENHVQNTFKSIHDEIEKSKSHGKSAKASSSTIIPSGKKWDD